MRLGLESHFTDEEIKMWEVSQLVQSYTTNSGRDRMGRRSVMSKPVSLSLFFLSYDSIRPESNELTFS